MTSPGFVTFTDPNGDTCRISTQGDISSITAIPISTTPGSVVCSRVRFSGGGFTDVQGTVAATATALGQVAPTGPVRLTNTPAGLVALASYGTDGASTAGTIYYSEGFNPCERTVTNIACMNGTTVGTDKVINAVWDSAGTLLGWTTLSGTLSATADIYQVIAAVTPFTLPAGRYYAGFQVEGTTAAHQTMAAATFVNSTGSLAGVFGTLANITPAGTFTATVGPFHQLS